jgi:hypothetical protein
MHIGPLLSPGVELLRWSFGLFLTASPWILGLGLLAAIGRAIQVGPGRAWPRPGYVAFEVLVECLRLLIFAVVIGLGDPAQGVRRIAAFISGGSASEALGRLGQGLGQRWPEALAALVLFALVAVVANLATFATAGLPSVRRLAAAALQDADQARGKLAAVLFIKNLTIIPFTIIWLWALLLYLNR